ncbi:hypothetical protein SAMN03159306_05413 [Pseudomonas sp. NFACC48-1]|nr:hypothetical protein SAMN03159405_04261 [Pseudomonas sp. NFACC44-2]SDA89776.1 hypothetical protein SAMN03159429_05657 [Pseudomonas sp. NFACC51]SFI16142.1 hypothetical protein SAMN03159302_03561 [Pseudomonas sp. NFACC54]SFT28363.1 hypothetical protein SAMN03159306_05413 [Pseudomonas sp. NFACC48-1]
MHSVFYATGQLTRLRLKPFDSRAKPIETKPSQFLETEAAGLANRSSEQLVSGDR